MDMETKLILQALLPALLIASGTATPLANAQSQTPVLGCYVDTPALDYPTAGSCGGLAPPRRTIVFEVMYRQTPYTRYSYFWTGCSSTSHYCVIQNAGSGLGEDGRTYTAIVLITDNQTGLTYTSTAAATLSQP